MLLRRLIPFWWFPAALAVSSPAARPTAPATRHFDIPAGPAEKAFRSFSAQAAAELVFGIDKVAGVETQAIRGDYVPLEALQRLVAGTALVALQDSRTGALAVARKSLSPQPSTSNQSSKPDHD